MSVMLEWVCGEAMCKHRFQAALPELPMPWPIICPKCNRSLYPDDILQNPEPGEILVPNRAELRAWSGGRSVERTAEELRRMRRETADSLVDELIAAMEPVKPARSTPRGQVTRVKPAPIKPPATPLATIKEPSWQKAALLAAAIIICLLLILLLTRL
jgi:hypothetical protein